MLSLWVLKSTKIESWQSNIHLVLSRDGSIADCIVRHSGVKPPFFAFKIVPIRLRVLSNFEQCAIKCLFRTTQYC